MAIRPAWQGFLRLSLVTTPVAIYAGTGGGDDVSFNLLNPKTGNRIRMVPTDPDTGPVERSSLVKGHAIDKGIYITLTDEEIRSVRPESARTISIDRFVPETEINRLYWNDPYYLAPDGDLGVEAFAVIREAMRTSRKVALGRVVMSNRERLLALEAAERGIVAHTLRTHDEVRSPGKVFDRIPEVKVDENMLAIAKQIVDQHAGPFVPSEFVDTYTVALRALIEAKRQDQKPTISSAPSEAQVVDLMAALKASLAPTPPRRKRRTTPARAAAERAGAEPKVKAPRKRAG